MSQLLALAILLVAGLLAGKLVQRIHLPSVTGYLLVGILVGPSVLGLVTPEILTEKLSHFIQIALMLIAFAIGEKLDLHYLGAQARRVVALGFGEAWGAFLLVGGGVLLVLLYQQPGPPVWSSGEYICLAALLGAIAMATAPAATLIVFREMGAEGPLTRCALPIVAVDNGIAITVFGIAMAITRSLGEGAAFGAGGLLAHALLNVFLAIGLGLVTGVVLDLFAHGLEQRSELLIAGLGSLLLCGEMARYWNLSPLLAGMAAGFIIVNRDRRDVRVFRAINQFEPPIYLLFFALAGAHLEIHAVVAMGAIGLVYLVGRAVGKGFGGWLVASLTGAADPVRKYLGVVLLPQAGVALGLAFLVAQIPVLADYSELVLPVVLASVVANELIGPPLVRWATLRTGEAHQRLAEGVES